MSSLKTSDIRVLISGHLPPPIGGVATYYRSLLDSSLPERVDLCFVQTSSQKRDLSQSGRFTLSNLILAIRDCVRFARAAMVHRPHIAHIATALGLSFIKHSICVVIARLLGSKVLLHPHCSFSVLYDERPRRWRYLFRQVIRLTNGVVALSNEWTQVQSVVPTCRVHYLPNAIDLAPYRSIAQEHMAHHRNSPPLTILYLGYVGKAKGTFDLIDAAAAVLSEGIDAVFELVGDELTPGEWAQLSQRIDKAQLNGHVRLRASVVGMEKLACFRNSDVLVYPSYHEGMPIAVIEAMACGLPIVATRVGGLPDLVSDGVNGVLVEPGQPDQLAAALHKLYLDSELRYAMQQNSYRLASQQHDIERCVTRLIDIYEDTLSSRQIT
jgi:glycosyltransferase involved in cell wall biosynthesis